MSSSETANGGGGTGQRTGSFSSIAGIEQKLFGEVASPAFKSTSFRFLDLPKELRDKVYEGPLCPHIDGAHLIKFLNVRDYGLEPAVLRTCKQIHKEASEVLYKQNRSAIITLDTKTWTILQKRLGQRPNEVQVGGPIAAFRWAFSPVVWLKHGKAGALPMLTMDMTVHSVRNTPSAKKAASEGKANERLVFIGFLSAVYSLCRYLTYYGLADQLQLAVRLERPVGESIQEELLDPFREVREVGRAIIIGTQLSSSLEITTLMVTPLAHINEILERGNVYESRARRQMREQKWNEARDTLGNTLDLVYDSWDLRRSLRGWGEKKEHEFNAMEMSLKPMYIECCIKIGRTLAAHRGLENLFSDLNLHYLGPDDYRLSATTTHYNLGVIFRDKGHLNAAAYSLLQALREVPGHQGADEAVDALEDIVEGSEDPDHVVVALNIKYTMKAFRHKTTDELSHEQSESIVRGFRGTIEEMQSLFQAPSPALATGKTFLMKPVL